MYVPIMYKLAVGVYLCKCHAKVNIVARHLKAACPSVYKLPE